MSNGIHEVFVLNSSRSRIAQLEDCKINYAIRFNDVGRWSITTDGRGSGADKIVEGNLIEICRNGTQMLAGKILTIDDGESGISNELLVSGADDLDWLAKRLAYPEVTGNFAAQAYDVRTGAGETAIKGYVNYNVGPGAIAARRAPGLTIEADGLRGSTVTGRARFKNLLKLCQELALSAGDIGFKIENNIFKVYTPADKTNTIKFSIDLGSMESYRRTREAPRANYVLCAASGTGTSRIVDELGDSDSIVTYGRSEMLRDRRDTSSASEITETMVEELAKNADLTKITFVPIELNQMRAYTDWWLGDKVTVVVKGTEYQKIIREIAVDADGIHETIAPTVGEFGARDTSGYVGSATARQIADAAARLQHLEAAE